MSDSPAPRAPAAAARAALAESVKPLLANAPAVIDGEAGEALHDLRIASRRLRAVVACYAPILPRSEAQACARDLKSVTDALGPSREWDVHGDGLVKELRRADGPVEEEAIGWLAAEVEARRLREHEGMGAALEALGIAEIAARALALPAAAEGGHALQEVARETIRGLWRSAKRTTRRARKHDDIDEMHEARIAWKKLRYALEVLAPAFEGDAAEVARARAHMRAKRLQDVLGKHHDKALLAAICVAGYARLADLGLCALALGLERAIDRLFDAQSERRAEFLSLTGDAALRDEIGPAIKSLSR